MTTSGVIGGEIPALLKLNTSFQRHSGDVSTLVSLLSNELEAAYWRGAAAERFKASWRDEFAPVLRRLAVELQENGREVASRAHKLELAGGV